MYIIFIGIVYPSIIFTKDIFRELEDQLRKVYNYFKGTNITIWFRGWQIRDVDGSRSSIIQYYIFSKGRKWRWTKLIAGSVTSSRLQNGMGNDLFFTTGRFPEDIPVQRTFVNTERQSVIDIISCNVEIKFKVIYWKEVQKLLSLSNRLPVAILINLSNNKTINNFIFNKNLFSFIISPIQTMCPKLK